MIPPQENGKWRKLKQSFLFTEDRGEAITEAAEFEQTGGFEVRVIEITEIRKEIYRGDESRSTGRLRAHSS